jgi:hypothetical protein
MRSIRARYLAGLVLPDVARRPLPILATDPTPPGEHHAATGHACPVTEGDGNHESAAGVLAAPSPGCGVTGRAARTEPA